MAARRPVEYDPKAELDRVIHLQQQKNNTRFMSGYLEGKREVLERMLDEGTQIEENSESFIPVRYVGRNDFPKAIRIGDS